MPIPFILGGIALVSGIAGIKKTFDAKSDYDSAKRMVNRAEENYRKNKRTLERKEVEIKEEISEYGEFKVRLYLEIIKDRYLPVLKKFKSSVKLTNLCEDKKLVTETINGINENVDIAEKLAKGTLEGIVKGAAGGASVAAGAWAIAGTFGVASTGTAISTLSGAALTSAASAWLGGGALAAGGFGVAGGTAILGGLVAGPLIAITGFSMAKKAEEAYYEARNYEDEMDIICEKMERMIDNYTALSARISEIRSVINSLTEKLELSISSLNKIYDSKKSSGKSKLLNFILRNNKLKLSESDEKELLKSFYLAKSIKSIFDLPLIKEDGFINEETEALLQEYY